MKLHRLRISFHPVSLKFYSVVQHGKLKYYRKSFVKFSKHHQVSRSCSFSLCLPAEACMFIVYGSSREKIVWFGKVLIMQVLPSDVAVS